MNCSEARQHILLCMYGELSFDEEEILEQHMAGCAGCRAERERLEKLSSLLDAGEAGLPAGLLARCRRDLSGAIQDERRRASFGAAVGSFWARWIVSPPLWARPLGAAGMLVLGFLGGRLVPADSPGLSPFLHDSAPPAVISKVRLVNPAEDGSVRVQYDEVRQRELQGSLNDERIRRLLLTAASDPSDPGLRVESIDILKDQTADEEVRRALLNALRGDTNSGVRLKALDALRPYARDPDTRKVLAQVLLTDDNPGVRTQAIDLLVQSKEPDVTGVLQQLLHREENGYIRSRTLKALDEMKASFGTF